MKISREVKLRKIFFKRMNKKLIICLIFLLVINCFGVSGLNKAIKNGDIATTKKLIADGADVNEPSGWSFTPLHYAAEKGNLEIAKLLIENGAFVNAIDVREYTPLHLAAKEGHAEMVHYLLTKGANKEMKASFSAQEKTPIDLAIDGMHDAATQVLYNWIIIEEKIDDPKEAKVPRGTYKDTVTLRNGEILEHVKATVKRDTVLVMNAKGKAKEYKKSEVKKISLR